LKWEIWENGILQSMEEIQIGNGGQETWRDRDALTQPRVCMRGHQTSCASWRDFAGLMMQSLDWGVSDAIILRAKGNRQEVKEFWYLSTLLKLRGSEWQLCEDYRRISPLM
jgi:hypothetical protein